MSAHFGVQAQAAPATTTDLDFPSSDERVFTIGEGEAGFYKINDSHFSSPSGLGEDLVLNVSVGRKVAPGAKADPVVLTRLGAEESCDFDVFLGYLAAGDRISASLRTQSGKPAGKFLPSFRLEKIDSIPVSRFPHLPDAGFDTGRGGQWASIGEATQENVDDRARAWADRSRQGAAVPASTGETALLQIPGSSSAGKELLVGGQAPSSGYYALDNAWIAAGADSDAEVSLRVYVGAVTKLQRIIKLGGASLRARFDADIGYVSKGETIYVALAAREQSASVAVTCALVEWAPRRAPLRVSRGADGYLDVHEPKNPGRAVDVPVQRWIEVPAKSGDCTEDIRRAFRRARVMAEDGAYAGIRLQRGKQYIIGSEQEKGKLFEITDVARLVFDGNGATLMVNGPELPRQRLELFTVAKSRLVAFCDFTVDSSTGLPFTVGDVLKVGPMTKGNQTVTFSVPKGQLDPLLEISRDGRAHGYAYDPKHPGRLAHGAWSFFPGAGEPAKQLRPAGKPGVFDHTVTRTDGSIPLESKWLVKNKGAGLTYLIVGAGSEDVSLSGMDGRACGGNLLLFWTVSGVNILDCKLEPQGSNWIAASSDGIHGQGREGPWIEDLLIRGVCEDIMNTYGASMVIEGDGNALDNVFSIRRFDAGRAPDAKLRQVSSDTLDVGDTLIFFNPEAGKVIGRASVEKVEGGRYTLSKTVGSVVEWGEGKRKRSTIVYNLDQCGRFFIRDSQFMDSLRFAVFIKARGGVIFGSLFEGLSANAILAANEPEWPEGPPAEDLWIQGSVFNQNNYDYSALQRTFLGVDPAQISIYTRKLKPPGALSPEDAVARGGLATAHIKLVGNTFMSWRGMGIAVRGARNVLIEGNAFHRPAEDAVMRKTLASDKSLGVDGKGRYGAVFLSDISGARVQDNVFYNLPAGDIPVALDDVELITQSNNASRPWSGPEPKTGPVARQ